MSLDLNLRVRSPMMVRNVDFFGAEQTQQKPPPYMSPNRLRRIYGNERYGSVDLDANKTYEVHHAPHATAEFHLKPMRLDYSAYGQDSFVEEK